MLYFFLDWSCGESSNALKFEEGGAGGIGWEQGLGVVGDCNMGKMAWREGDWERDGSAMGLGLARRNEDG